MNETHPVAVLVITKGNICNNLRRHKLQQAGLWTEVSYNKLPLECEITGEFAPCQSQQKHVVNMITTTCQGHSLETSNGMERLIQEETSVRQCFVKLNRCNAE